MIFSRVHRDFDNGREVFDVEFHVGTTEYNFDVDANTGAVVDFDTDFNDFGDFFARKFSARNPTFETNIAVYQSCFFW